MAKSVVSKYVINPLTSRELLSFLDEKSKNILKYFIVKSLFSQPESKVGQKRLPIQIPKEHIEQWFTQALDVKPVGAGSYPIDIYNDRDRWGADIKMLNITLTPAGGVSSKDSGEASLGQKFAGPGVDLDQMFERKKFEKIKNQWLDLYLSKYKSLGSKYAVDKIYYFFILRPGTQSEGADFYFSGAIIDLDQVRLVKVNKNRTTKKSVFLDNFIDKEFGSTKIYKAKKRLELRLRPKKWVESNMMLKITTSYDPKKVNLRGKNIGLGFLRKQMEKMKKVQVSFLD